MKYLLLLFYFLFLSFSLSGQDDCTRHPMDSIQDSYSLQPLTKVAVDRRNRNIPPPPPPPSITTDNVHTNYNCDRKYTIPDSVFLNIYPFNADSIVVVYPDSSCDSFSKYEDYRDYNVLGTMTQSEIGDFADQLYNYDYIEQRISSIKTTSITRINRPDIVLLFYHNGNQNRLLLYFDEAPQLRVEDTFGGLYRRAKCVDLYHRLLLFFEEKYGYNITSCTECELQIMELERK